MKTNLCIVSLSSLLTKTIAKCLSERLGMFYVDVNEMLQFELVDIVDAQQRTSVEYIEKVKTKQVKNLASFENTLISIDVSTFLQKDNAKNIDKGAYIIFLNVPQTSLKKLLKKEGKDQSDEYVQMLVYNERTQFCQNICDFEIEVSSLNKKNIVSQIVKDLSTYKYT